MNKKTIVIPETAVCRMVDISSKPQYVEAGLCTKYFELKQAAL